jgi:flagellar hook-associated protein 2
MATGLQVAGLASNFDWKSFVDQIMDVERTPAKRLETERATNVQKTSLLSSLGARLTALQTAVQGLKTDTLFGTRTAALSGTGWSAAAGTDTAAGTYKFAVTQVAAAASLRGSNDIGAALNATSDDVSGLTLANLPIGQAITAGTFSVNGKQVTVALTDSLQDVFDAIATATGGTVTASYDHTTDGVTLTSSTGALMLGAANDSTNFLRSLKLGNTGGASASSTGRLGGVKTGGNLAGANLTTAITAVDGTGAGTFSINGVAIAYNVNSDSLAGVISRINQSTAGVTASYDAVNDRMVLANKSTGDVGIAVSEASGGLLGALGLSAGTTFTRGKNAEFTLNDGSVISSLSNTLDATAHGVAGLSVTATTVETQTVTVAPDTTAMRAKLDSFVTAFNDVQQFIDTNTKVTTDAKLGKVTAAALASNREIQDWAHSLRTMAFAAVSGLTGSVKRLDDLGLDFKSGTNELTISDSAKLDKALADSTTDVGAFFTTATAGFGAKFNAFIEKIAKQNSDQQDRISKTNTSIDDQIAAIDRHLVQQRAIMESAFIQMETVQAKLKQQQQSLNSFTTQSTSG